MKEVSLWPLKLHYLTHGLGKKNMLYWCQFQLIIALNIGSSPVLPFMAVIMRQLGMPGSGIGMTYALIHDEKKTPKQH